MIAALLTPLMATFFGALDWLLCIYIQVSALVNAVIDVAATSTTNRQGNTFHRDDADRRIQRHRQTMRSSRSPYLPHDGGQQAEHLAYLEKKHQHTLRILRMAHQEYAIKTHPCDIQQQFCYIQQLPNEILMAVFEMVGVGPDLLSCTLVCHQWHRLVTPIMWRAPVPSHPICCLPPFTTFQSPLNEQQPNHRSRSFSRNSFNRRSISSTRSSSSSTSSTSSSTSSRSSTRSSGSISSISSVMSCASSCSVSSIGSQLACDDQTHSCFPPSSFPIHVEKYGHAIRNLALPHVHLTDCSLRHIAIYCPNLIHIALDNSCITNDSLYSLSKAACAPRLQSISLRHCRQITNSGLRALAATCHSLESVNLAGCSRIAHQGVTHLVAANPQLRSVDLSDCGRVTGATVREIASLCGTQLEHLSLARLRGVSQADMQALVDHCPNLKRLNLAKQKRLRHPSSSSSEPFAELIESLLRYNIQPDLSVGSYQHHQQLLLAKEQDTLSDDTLLLLIRQLPQLTHLDVSHWTTLSENTVHTLVRQGHALAFLRITGCQHITCRSFGCECREKHRDKIISNRLVIDGLTAC